MGIWFPNHPKLRQMILCEGICSSQSNLNLCEA